MSQRTPQMVLRNVAGWEDAALTELKGGLTNTTWLAEKNGLKAVLKVDQDVRGRPYNSRPEEARVQSRAASAGLAGEILYVDDTALMCGWTAGIVGEPASICRDDVIDRVAMALKRLHGLAPTGRRLDAAAAARSYAAIIRHADDDVVDKCVHIVESTRATSSPVLCHNDLVAENIVILPEVRFLDWEYARDNDPLFDLATLVEHHALPDDAADRLLDTYFDGDGDRHRDALDGQRQLYRALTYLWQASRKR